MNESRGQTAGPWTLHEQLGHGGNGTVWKATHPGTEIVVALKVLNVTKIEHESYPRVGDGPFQPDGLAVCSCTMARRYRGTHVHHQRRVIPPKPGTCGCGF